MDICIFYSWQSKYRNNCDHIIGKALDKAVKELNQNHPEFHYEVERGGGDVLGAEHIDNNIDKIIKTKADLAIIDFTHTGRVPQLNPETREWNIEKCVPNTCATFEAGKLEGVLDPRQVFKVYNTMYGDLKTNLEMPFDLRQEHFPIPFRCADEADDEERKQIVENLKKSLVALLWKGTEVFLNNQKARFSPFAPMRNEYAKKLYQTPFKSSKPFERICKIINSGRSIRLLGLPGLGKTRMIGEAFRGNDNDVYYCDCKEQNNGVVMDVIDKLLSRKGSRRQVIVLDNCEQKLCSFAGDIINENGYNCQLITIFYDPREDVDTGIEGITIKVDECGEVVKAMVDEVMDMPKEDKETIISLSGGFPLMASIMIENYNHGISLVHISKKDVFERMLNIDPQNVSDQDILKVLTAFSIFKYIGLYGPQEKHGRFISDNRIITNLHGTADEKLQLFKEVHGLYQKTEILERQGNLVLMRLIPLAIFLCKDWFDKQTTDSIADLINQIRSCSDEGTRNMLIESLSRRIMLLNEIPLAKELNDGLTDPEHSPFLTEEVVLSTPGSRLFLAFSEVNPESCALALHRMILKKSDKDIESLEPVRRNLSWALDHLAFDKRSFKNAMLTLARFSLVETEDRLANNTTALFVDRFVVLLPGTEMDLMTRLEVLNELSADDRYVPLIKKALCHALSSGNFHRAGGAEKQGMRTLNDYEPSPDEINAYYHNCLEMLLHLMKTPQDLDEIANALASNARGYYLMGLEDFLFDSLRVIAPMKDYAWDEMKDALAFLIDYDAKKRNNNSLDEVVKWKKRLTKDDYVYTLLHLGDEISRHYNISFEEERKLIYDRYAEMARELVDKHLYRDSVLISGIMSGQCFHYNDYGIALSSFSKESGVQEEILDVLLEQVTKQEVSKDGEMLLVYYFSGVEERKLVDKAYDAIIHSEKTNLLPALYAIKDESEDKLALLFDLLDQGLLALSDFGSYFNYKLLKAYNVKYVARRLLDYGSEGAGIVLTHCHNLLFGNNVLDEEYESIGRKCLMIADLQSIPLHGYVYLQSVNNYLVKHRDEELALHIQELQENSFHSLFSQDNYYLGRLYSKVLKRYCDLLKPRVFELLEDEQVRHSWIDLMRTSYPQETEAGDPLYMFIPFDEWFGWLNKSTNNDRAYVLAMMFRFSDGIGASLEYLRLIDNHWCEEVRGALSSRFHSFSWVGSGIPLYQNRIVICEDYINKLTNTTAKEWFQNDISFWEKEIEQERLENAHQRAIYD